MSQIPPVPPGGSPPPGSPPPGGPPPGGGWGPPQAPYGAPPPVPGAGHGPKGGGRGGGPSGAVVALVAVAIVAIVAIGGFVLLRGDDGGDPAAAVDDFFQAAQDRDCERMISLVSEASWSQDGEATREEALSQCAEEIQDEEFFPAGTTITATEVARQDGDTAQVEVTTSSQALGEQTETIPVVNEDGRWVVDFASQEVGGSNAPEAPEASEPSPADPTGPAEDG